MPVVLARAGGAFTHLKVHPTRAGQAHAVTQLGDTEQASADRWKTMPPLSTVNLIETIKPGATTLLSATDDRRRERVVLAYERYGRGKSIAFPVQDSWMWQMHATIRVDDQTHENFWRQLLRWLVDGVPDAVETRPITDRVEPGQPVVLTADVVDPRFVELNDATVVARVTSPSGKALTVPMQWTGERNGQYRASFETSETGWYEKDQFNMTPNRWEHDRMVRLAEMVVTDVCPRSSTTTVFPCATRASTREKILNEAPTPVSELSV